MGTQDMRCAQLKRSLGAATSGPHQLPDGPGPRPLVPTFAAPAMPDAAAVRVDVGEGPWRQAGMRNGLRSAPTREARPTGGQPAAELSR